MLGPLPPTPTHFSFFTSADLGFCGNQLQSEAMTCCNEEGGRKGAHGMGRETRREIQKENQVSILAKANSQLSLQNHRISWKNQLEKTSEINKSNL